MDDRASRHRVEDRGMLTGRTAYTRDLPAADCLALTFVRSIVAHGTIRSIDIDEAAAAPGVHAVVTGADLNLPPFNFFDTVPAEFARPLPATETVRHVGEPVAMVVADTAARALDAAELVAVDIQPLEPAVHPETAAGDAAVLHPEVGTNTIIHYDRGVADDFFAGAAHVERGRFPNQRLASAPMEPSAVIARPTDSGGLEVWATSQGVHVVQEELSRALGMDPAAIRVRTPAVGGGFGGRHSAPVELLLVAAVARHLNVAVRWDETRTENLLTMVHGRAQDHTVEMGFDEDGAVTGVRVHNLADCGAYPHFGPVMPFISRKLATGPYRIDHVEYEWRAVATSTNPIGPYRGAGQPEATNGLERTIENAARSLDVDPLDLRRRNLLTAAELPHQTPTGFTYDSGDYVTALDRAAELIGYDGVRAEQKQRRHDGDPIQIGVGFSSYVSMVDSRSEFGGVSVEADGTVIVRCGTLNHGQGHATTLGRIVADALGIGIESVRYVDNDTDMVPEGHGTGGSRSAQMGGGAVAEAAALVLDRAREVAAGLLEADPADIIVQSGDGDRPGGLAVAGVPTSVIPWSAVAEAAGAAGLGAESTFEPTGASHPSGTHATVVEVDTETGEVRVRTHVAVDDCGTVLNPPVVEGQQHGGIAAGIGQALYEEIVYDADGTPRSTTFADYLLPSAAELPMFVTETAGIPAPHVPNGAKGIGENGAIAAPTAVQNAVVDALAHLGVTHIDLPMTPERVWSALNR